MKESLVHSHIPKSKTKRNSISNSVKPKQKKKSKHMSLNPTFIKRHKSKETKFPQLSTRARNINNILNTRGKKLNLNDPNLKHLNSTKHLRMKAYEANRRNDGNDIDVILPRIAMKKNKFHKKGINSKTQKSLQNLINISQLNESRDLNKSLASEENGSEVEETEDEDHKIDKEKYKFLNDATGYSIDQLNRDEKEDSFIKSTKPLSTIVNYLGLFKGLFTRRSLEVYYYEALFILEQDYDDLKKTLMINEVIRLCMAVINNEMFPSDTFIPNLFNVLLKGVMDVLKGNVKIVYPHKMLKKFCIAMALCIEKEKLNNLESIEKFMEFMKEIPQIWEEIPDNVKNLLISNFVDFMWFFTSDFTYYIKRKDDYGLNYKLSRIEYLGNYLEFCFENIVEFDEGEEGEEVDNYKSLKLKVERLVYSLIELIVEGWDEETELNLSEKRIIGNSFEYMFMCMKAKATKEMVFRELTSQCSDGIFTIFDRYFMLLTKHSHPLSLEKDFGDTIPRCVRHWRTVFAGEEEDQVMVELKLGILIQINMILYQLIKSFNLDSLDHFIVDFMIGLVKASIDIVGTVQTVKRKKEFTNDIRVSLDEILAKINFSRVPKRFEGKMNKLNEDIVIFLKKIDALRSKKR